MSALIRFKRFDEKPFLLEAHRARAEPDDVRMHHHIATSDTASATLPHPAEDLLSVRSSSTADSFSEAGVTVALTYAEYKEQFQRELESLREESVRDGHRDGEQRVRQQLESEYAEKIDIFSRLLASARDAFESDIEALHEIGAEIVYESVLKILGNVLITREGAHAVIREVIKCAKDTTRLTVRLSPFDFQHVNREREALLGNLNVGLVDIVPDERVELGGCLLEAPGGNLDGRLEVQLQCLREALLNVRARHFDGDGVP